MESLAALFVLLLGFAAGWYLRSRRGSIAVQTDDGLAHKLQQRDEELRAARSEIAVHSSTLDTLRNEIAVLSKKGTSPSTKQNIGKPSPRRRSAPSKKNPRSPKPKGSNARGGRK